MTVRRTVAALAATGLVAAGCAQGPNEIVVTVDESLAQGDAATHEVALDGVPDVDAVAADGLAAPSSIDFLPDGRAVVVERTTGRVLLVDPPAGATAESGELVEAGTLPRVRARAGSGLLGVAVSPSFDEDGLVYFYLTTKRDNRVVRASLEDDALGEPEVVLAGIPAAGRRNGGALLFAEDGSLFVGTGDANRPETAQRRGSLAGKVLRITTDGEPTADNPFKKSVVWSLGHGNVVGLAVDDDGRLWAAETGQGTADEINVIKAGKNYGWPRWEGPVEVAPNAPGPDRPTEPVETLAPQVAGWSGIVWSRGFLWAAAAGGRQVWRMKAANGEASDPRGFLEKEYGRLHALALAPDGRLWLGTARRATEDEPAPDQVLVVTP